MPIYKLIFLIFCVAAPVFSQAATLEEFLSNTSAPSEIQEISLHSEAQVEKCLVDREEVFCVYGRLYPNIAKNPQARQAILQSLSMLGRSFLMRYLGEKIKAANLKQDLVVHETLQRTANQEITKLRDLKFMTFSRGNWCGFVCALPIHEAQITLPEIYKSKSFVMAYCQTLMPKAMQLMESAKYSEALLSLKELHDLKFANIDAYLLAVKAFMLEKQPDEAKKIAIELLNDMSEKMNQEQTETLGDLFMKLKMNNEAEKAYLISAGKFSKW